jgi:FKBP-type peptidyl-prolyl cis-trans isomerase FkpA
MIKRLTPILFLLGMFSMIACEPNNPFDTGPKYDERANLKIDSVKVAAFLDTARIDSIYRIHDRSGVVIIVQKEGIGTRPTLNTVVYVNYTGYLLEGGKVFDTSFENVARENGIFSETRNYSPLSFILGANQVIGGWELGIARLRPGTKAVLVIPSPYGYRDAGSGERIPPNAPLVFKIDFLGID